jgi:hypothetical protein
VCGKQRQRLDSGGQVRDAHPATEGALKTELAMMRAGVVGRASKKAMAAWQLMLWRSEREVWHATVDTSCVASSVSWVAWATAAECIRCGRARKPLPCAQRSCVCASGSTVWTTCLVSDQIVAKCWCGGEERSQRCCWGFGHGCLCQSIGGQASSGIMQGRGLADTESAVPEGESKLCLCRGGGSRPQDLLGAGGNSVMYLVGGARQGFGGAVQWGGARYRGE